MSIHIQNKKGIKIIFRRDFVMCVYFFYLLLLQRNPLGDEIEVAEICTVLARSTTSDQNCYA